MGGGLVLFKSERKSRVDSKCSDGYESIERHNFVSEIQAVRYSRQRLAALGLSEENKAITP
jgi:hypothetical protein